MKKQLIILLSVCVAMLMWVPSGFSNPTYTNDSDGLCGACHGTGFGTPLHDVHCEEGEGCSEFWNGDCDSCHADGSPANSPLPSTCVVCHPYPETGKCQLVSKHEAGNCSSCHESGTSAPCDELECVFDADCEEGEICNDDAICVPSAPVACSSSDDCEDGEECVEDVCVAAAECTEAADCDDADLCTTDECTEGACVNTAVDCAGDICNPTDGTCVECLIDGDCEEDETCTDNMCIAGGCPEGTPEPVLTFDKDGDCLLNKDELKAYSDSLKTVQKAEKDTLKTKQKLEKDVQKQKQSLEKDQYKLIKTNFSA